MGNKKNRKIGAASKPRSKPRGKLFVGFARAKNGSAKASAVSRVGHARRRLQSAAGARRWPAPALPTFQALAAMGAADCASDGEDGDDGWEEVDYSDRSDSECSDDGGGCGCACDGVGAAIAWLGTSAWLGRQCACTPQPTPQRIESALAIQHGLPHPSRPILQPPADDDAAAAARLLVNPARMPPPRVEVWLLLAVAMAQAAAAMLTTMHWITSSYVASGGTATADAPAPAASDASGFTQGTVAAAGQLYAYVHTPTADSVESCQQQLFNGWQQLPTMPASAPRRGKSTATVKAGAVIVRVERGSALAKGCAAVLGKDRDWAATASIFVVGRCTEALGTAKETVKPLPPHPPWPSPKSPPPPGTPPWLHHPTPEEARKSIQTGRQRPETGSTVVGTCTACLVLRGGRGPCRELPGRRLPPLNMCTAFLHRSSAAKVPTAGASSNTRISASRESSLRHERWWFAAELARTTSRMHASLHTCKEGEGVEVLRYRSGGQPLLLLLVVVVVLLLGSTARVC